MATSRDYCLYLRVSSSILTSLPLMMVTAWEGAGSQLRHSRPAPNPGSKGLHLLAMGRAIHGEAKRSQQPAGPLPHKAVDIGVVNGMVALPTDTWYGAGVT